VEVRVKEEERKELQKIIKKIINLCTEEKRKPRKSANKRNTPKN